MIRYREVAVVDDIDRLERLITICCFAHELIGNKEDVLCVLLDFAMPKLDEMKNKLRINDG